MRGVLLDTNALIWMMIDDPRLGPDARMTLTTATDAAFSSVSILEITITTMLGRIKTPDDPLAAARATGLRELAFTAEHARQIGARPELVRHDPFDRMLLAQAEHEQMMLLTADRALLGLGHPWVVSARA